MQMHEACTPWEPIPEAANHYYMIHVSHVEEIVNGIDFQGATFAITSQWRQEGRDTTSIGTWLLKFTGVACYRRRSYGDLKGFPLTRPDDTRGLWEIFPSHYVEEFTHNVRTTLTQATALPTLSYRHFVILTGNYVMYEVVANAWSCDELPNPVIGAPAGRLDGARMRLGSFTRAVQSAYDKLLGRGFHDIDIVRADTISHDALDVTCTAFREAGSGAAEEIWLQASIMSDGSIEVIMPDDIDSYF